MCVAVKPAPSRARRVALAHLALEALRRVHSSSAAAAPLQLPSWRAVQLVACAADAVAALVQAVAAANATVASTCNANGVGVGCSAATSTAAAETKALRDALGSDGGVAGLSAMLAVLRRAFAADASAALGRPQRIS